MELQEGKSKPFCGLFTMKFTRKAEDSGCSAARLARLPWAQEVPGSNPGIPT